MMFSILRAPPGCDGTSACVGTGRTDPGFNELHSGSLACLSSCTNALLAAGCGSMGTE